MSDREQIELDYAALTTACGFVDITDLRSRVELRGDDRRALLHSFCTNDIRGLADAAGCEAFLLHGKGTVLFYVQVWQRPDGIVLDAGRDRGEAIIKHLDRYIIREKVTLHDRTAEWGELVVAGANASAVLHEAFGVAPPDVPQTSVAVPALPETIVVRSNWTLGMNFVVIGPREQIAGAQERLTAAGAKPCGFAPLDALRIEAGLPLDGIDVTEKNLAQEVDRNDLTLHFKKGCYLGQETVARLDALGHVNKTLVRVKFTDAATDATIAPGLELQQGGAVVGQVTSVAYSPGRRRWVGLGYLKQGTNQFGTRLESPHGTAEVVSHFKAN